MTGKRSFYLFIVGSILIGLVMLVSLVTACGQSYTQPCSASPSVSGVIATVFGIFVCAPLLAISFVMSIFALIQDRQRKYALLPFIVGLGIIAAIAVSLTLTLVG